MKLIVKKGTTSKRIAIFIQDSSSTTGAGLTGLANTSGGLVSYRHREDDGNVGGTQITLGAGTRGTWSSGGFVEKDTANMPGVYEFGIPDNVLATGANWAVIMLKGATNMAPVVLEIQLVDVDLQDSAAFGLSRLDAAISSRMATFTLSLKKNQALNAFEFEMIDSADHVSAKTLLAVTAQRSIDGGAYASCANAVTEVGSGTYKIDLAASDLNGNVITLKFTAGGADATKVTIITQG